MHHFSGTDAKEVIENYRPFVERGLSDLLVGLVSGHMEPQSVEAVCQYFAMICEKIRSEYRQNLNSDGYSHSSTAHMLKTVVDDHEAERS